MSTSDETQPRGPHPDPPVDDNLDIAESETDPGTRPITESPDPEDDDVDEASKQSFPSSDPPANWAGSD